MNRKIHKKMQLENFKRVKFGADSVLYFPFIYGGTKLIGKVAKYGKDLAFSSSKINKTIDNAAGVRPHQINLKQCFWLKTRERSKIGCQLCNGASKKNR